MYSYVNWPSECSIEMFLEIWLLHDWLIKCRLSRGRYSNFLQVLRCPPPLHPAWDGGKVMMLHVICTMFPIYRGLETCIYIFTCIYIYIHMSSVAYHIWNIIPKKYIHILCTHKYLYIYTYLYISIAFVHHPFFHASDDGSGPTQRWRLRRDALKGGRYHVEYSRYERKPWPYSPPLVTPPRIFEAFHLSRLHFPFRCCADTNLDEKYFSQEGSLA